MSLDQPVLDDRADTPVVSDIDYWLLIFGPTEIFLRGRTTMALLGNCVLGTRLCVV